MNMSCRGWLGIFAFGFLLLTEIVQAETKIDLSRCTFANGASGGNSQILRGRVLQAGSLKVNLGSRFTTFRCVDSDQDGFSELAATINQRKATFQITPLVQSRKLSTVCKNIRGLNRGEIYKSRASDHINDRRKFSTSFITLANTPAPKNYCLYGYDKSGNLVHKLGRYFPTGSAYSSRFYGGHGCGDGKSASSVAALATRNTKSPSIYLTSGTGNCAYVPHANSCYNSSAC